MRLVRPFASVVLLGLFSLCVSAQQPAPAEPTQSAAPQPMGQRVPAAQTPPPLAKANDQGAALLQKCLAAVGANPGITDASLTGKLTILMPGGTTNTGTIVMAAKGDSQAQITMQTATGTHTEVRSVSSEGIPAEMRTSPDGTVTHNPTSSLFTPHPAWFFPQFVLSAQPASNLSSAFIASETRAGVPVNHIEVWQSESSQSTPSAAAPAIATQHFTQYDVYLDPTTSFPVSMVYWVQPVYPNDSSTKYFPRDNRVPVEIQFSNYQSVQGVPVAHQITAFLQGRQIYSIQVSSATLNSGVVIPAVD